MIASIVSLWVSGNLRELLRDVSFVGAKETPRGKDVPSDVEFNTAYELSRFQPVAS